MKYNKMTRRMFLQGSGNMLMAMPFLTSLLPKSAWSQTTPNTIKRFVSLLTTYDYGHNSVWLPNTSGSISNLVQPNRVITPGNGMTPVRWQPLREFAPTNSSNLALLYGNRFSANLSYMNIIRGLDMADFRGHDCSRALGGFTALNAEMRGSLQYLPTIDHVINNNRNFNPGGLALIFAGADGHTEHWSHSVAPNSSTRTNSIGYTLSELYAELFNEGTFPESGQSTPVNPRRDLLSRVLEDYNRVRNSRNISRSDRQSLDDVFDKISDVQRGLAVATTSACSHRSLIRTGNQITYATLDAPAGKAWADMITAGMMCDVFRTFTLGGEFAQPEAAGRAPLEGVPFDHDETHSPFASINGSLNWQRVGRRQAQFAQNLVAPLVQNLAGAIDPSNGQTYLHNSLLFMSTEAGQTHSPNSLPVITFGNAGGAFTSGNYIDYSDRSLGVSDHDEATNRDPNSPQFCNNYKGVHYNRFLLNILQAMGLQPSDYESYGNKGQFLNRTNLGPMNNGITTDIGGWGYPVAYDITRSDYLTGEALRRVIGFDNRLYRNKLVMPV